MTISYSGNFYSLLLRWRGSLWRSVWKELCVFLILYYLIRFVYDFALDQQERETFEKIALTFNHYTQLIPLTFLLGFYVSSVVNRWWAQFELVAWPDDLLSVICFAIKGDDELEVMKRHQIARYLCLTCALAWRDISLKVRERFPSMRHLVVMGMMTEKELQMVETTPSESLRWALPLQWTQKMIRKELSAGTIPAPIAGMILKEISNYRTTFKKLYCYDWVCIPLVYTQVTALATYGYFAFCLVGRQFLDPAKKYPFSELDFIVPIFSILQFLFYIGWFKVGQELLRPFGPDDDDIELNYILNRHVQACFAMVKNVFDQEPEIVRDQFWEQDVVTLGHTKLSAKQQEHPPKLHVDVKIKLPEEEDPADEQALLKNSKKKEMKKIRPF